MERTQEFFNSRVRFMNLIDKFGEVDETGNVRLFTLINDLTKDIYTLIQERELTMTDKDGEYEIYDNGDNAREPFTIRSTDDTNTQILGVSDKRIFNIEEMVEKRLKYDFGFDTKENENNLREELEMLYPKIIENVLFKFHKVCADYKILYEGKLRWIFATRIH